MKEEVMEQVKRDTEAVLEELIDAYDKAWLNKSTFGSKQYDRGLQQIISISIKGTTIKGLIEGYANGKLVELAAGQNLPESKLCRKAADELRPITSNLRGYMSGYCQSQVDMRAEHWFKVIKEEK